MPIKQSSVIGLKVLKSQKSCFILSLVVLLALIGRNQINIALKVADWNWWRCSGLTNGGVAAEWKNCWWRHGGLTSGIKEGTS
jgi:hypothetical protein